MSSNHTILNIFPLLALLTPQTASAQLVSCTGPDCTFCSVVVTADRMVELFVIALFGVAILLMAYVGFELVTSAGNTEARDRAKDRFTNLIIGLVLVFAAWTIVDTIFKAAIDADAGLGVWHDVSEEDCGIQRGAAEGTETTLPGGGQLFDPDATDTIGVEVVGSQPTYDTSLLSDTCNPGTPNFPACAEVTNTSTMTPSPSADGSFTYNSGIQSQLPHASARLRSMLNCIAGIVPGNVGRISSISDGQIVSGQHTWAQCRAGSCQHAANSCHYGGRTCGDQSYAVDFGDEENVSAICAAARSCGAVADCSVHGGNHVHLSLPGCGCDGY